MASSKARSRNRPAQGKSRPGAGARVAAGKPAGPVVAATPTSPTSPAGQAQARQAKQAQAQARSAKQAQAQARPAKQAERQPVEVTEEPARPSGPPLWLQLVTLALAVLGLGVSAYETYAHYTGSHLAGCPSGGHGTFNCFAVITSSQSMVFGVIPVAILGLAFYVFVVAIMTPWAWRAQRHEVAWLRLASMIAGMGFVMYLIYAEVYQIGQICEYCTGVHIITFLLFCVTVVSVAIWGLGKPKTAA